MDASHLAAANIELLEQASANEEFLRKDLDRMQELENVLETSA